MPGSWGSKPKEDMKWVLAMHYNRILNLTAIVPSESMPQTAIEKAFVFAMAGLESAMSPEIEADNQYQIDLTTKIEARYGKGASPQAFSGKAEYRLMQLWCLTMLAERRGLRFDRMIIEYIGQGPTEDSPKGDTDA